MSRALLTGRILGCLILVPTAAAVGQGTQGPDLVVDTVASGLRQISALVFISRDTAIVASHWGTISRLDVRTGRHTPLSGAPVPVGRVEAGTRDLALHPDFERNRLLYISVVMGEELNNTLVVMRARLDGDVLRDTTAILLTAAMDTSVNHYGGQLLFHDGYLFVSGGDRHNRPRVQDLGYHTGKILRILPDGSVPPDNPFVGRPGARPEIWSYGHRNVQGLAYDSARGILWAHEHGPRHGDEVNIIERGRDYGWPRVSWGWEYEGGPIGAGIPVDSATPVPEWVWSPNVAPSGLLVYSGRAIPEWSGNLLSGTMHQVRGHHLNRLVWDGTRIVLEERLFSGQLGRVRFVSEDERGWIYVGNDDGQVLRIRPRFSR